MKRLILFTALAAISLSTMAQDDLYFNPKDEPKTEERPAAPRIRPGQEDPWRGGCPRDIDEYNRRGRLQSRYEKIGTDSLGNDIIQFQAGDGVYPDYTVADTLDPGMQVYPEDNDYACSRRMSRWDDWYGPYDLWYASRWGWGWPYRYGYYGWYDPWYADLYWGWGGYYGWYSPWYYGYGPGWGWGYGWGHPGWGGHYHGGIAGSMNHGTPVRRGTSNAYGSFGGRRTATAGTTSNSRVSRFGNSTAQSNRSFGGQRRTTTSNVNTMSRSNMPSRSTSSFGGSRGSFSGGSFGGGSRGGGGSFGGGSRGGGGSFGGRR